MILIFILVFMIVFLLYLEDVVYIFKVITHPYSKVEVDPFSNVKPFSNKILILSMDDRDLDYLPLHCESWTNYSNLYGYTYLFEKICNTIPIYFCKFQRILELMESTDFQYYIWVDSDTIVNKKFKSFSLESLISQMGENVDIITSHYSILNFFSGPLIGSLYIFRKSTKMISFLQSCLSKIDTTRWKTNKKCDSCVYAGRYYEEAALFYTILENPDIVHKVMSGNVISNKSTCETDYFIIHHTDKETTFSCFENNI